MQKIADETTLIMVRVDRTIKAQFAEICGVRSMSEVVRQLINDFINTKLSVKKRKSNDR